MWGGDEVRPKGVLLRAIVGSLLRRIIVVHGADHCLVLGGVEPGHSVNVRDEGMAQLHGITRNSQGFCIVAPGTAIMEFAFGAVQPKNGAEHAILHPACVQFRFFQTVRVPSNVVAPPAVANVGGGGGKIWLEIKAIPIYMGIAGEANGVAMVAQPPPTREDKRPFPDLLWPFSA